MKWYEMFGFALGLGLLIAIITYYFGSQSALFCLIGMIIGALIFI